MSWIKLKIKDMMGGMQEAIRDDIMRKELMFEWLNILLALVSFFMTIVNVFTREYILMLSTLLFSAACIGNTVLIRKGKKTKNTAYLLFVAETIALLTFFLVTGIPNGFSALWLCLIPSFSLLIFGKRYGTCYSIGTFLLLIFFFWLPFGRGLLWYHYTEEFMLRFPFFFAACYLLALFIEIIRAQTQNQLLESEQKYYFLYCHDALTGLYNRYGFNALVDADYEKADPGKVGMIIFDIDDFKHVNDQYGHNNGDVVLRGVAEIIRNTFCSQTHYCRWGGEEFMVYMHCGHDYEESAERFRRYVEEAEFKAGDLVIKVTVSIGLCISESIKNASVATLVNKADQCLYMAKDRGKNCVVSAKVP